MRELREDTFSGNKNNDAHEHVERVLDIVSLFNIPGVSRDDVMLHVFPITLTGAAKRWVDRLSPGTIDSWDLLKKPLSKGTVHHPKPLSSLKKSVTSSRKVTKHYTKLQNGTMNHQLLDSQGPIAGMTPAQALTAIQTMADHSQKWHDGSSSRNIDSSSNFEGIANKLENLDKECPLNEEVKSIEEVKYGEFKRSSPFSSGAKYRVGPLGYYTCIDNRQPFGEKRPSLEELMNKHLEESTRKRAEMEE
ncbi:hypothetical protein Tco_0721904 [Tanacetum coccineum]